MNAAQQEKVDFKTHLLDILVEYMEPAEHIIDGGHSITVCIPGCTPMNEAASFFFNMISMYMEAHFSEKKSLFDPDSIRISYGHQCIELGIMIYE